jgi:hypothetical protein
MWNNALARMTWLTSFLINFILLDSVILENVPEFYLFIIYFCLKLIVKKLKKLILMQNNDIH